MSRIGNMPVIIPDKVSLKIENGIIFVKGPLGELTQDYKDVITFEVEGNVVKVGRKNEEKQSKAYHGLYRKLLFNMVEGVSKGFSKVLLINGVGYKAEAKGGSIILDLGYSTRFEYILPKGVEAKVENQTKITLSSFNKVLVGQSAAEIRKLRKIEPYKLKGIKYEKEKIKQKAGKTSAKK